MRALARLLLVLAVLAVPLSSATPAAAATPPVGVFPTWVKTGPGAFTGSFAAASGFPDVAVVTDDTGASVAAGRSAFLGPTTGFGQQFGTSRLQPYLTIASLGQTAASTTTVTFDGPTPAGWGIAVGDIDADYVTLAATGPGGAVAPPHFGAQDSTAGSIPLNYCLDASPKPGTCTTAMAPYTDYPELCGTGSTYPLCASLPPGTISAVGHGSDTAGSYDWFMPTVPITQLTLTFTPLSGLPNFQLWLVAPSPAATVTGSVAFEDPATPIPDGTSIQLLDDSGAPVTDMLDEPVLVPVDPDGGFSFETGFGDYEIDLEAPSSVVPPEEFPLAITVDSDTLDLGTFAISAAAAPGDPSDPDELVRTGVDPFWPLVGAGVVLAVGLLLLVKRRRTKDTADGDELP